MRVPSTFFILLLTALVAAVSAQPFSILEQGVALVHGAYLPVDGIMQQANTKPELGFGVHAGHSRVKRLGASRWCLAYGFRLRYRRYCASIRYSSAYVNSFFLWEDRYEYSGEYRSRELKLGLPTQLWFKASERSFAIAGIELQAMWPLELQPRIVQTHTRIERAPDGSVISSTVSSTTSIAATMPREQSASLYAELMLGYRYDIGEGMQLGLEFSIVARPPNAAPTAGGPVGELSLWCAWVIPGKRSQSPSGT